MMKHPDPGGGNGRAGKVSRRRLPAGILVLSVLLSPPAWAQQGAPAAAAEAEPVPSMPMEVMFESSMGDVRFPHNVHLKFGCVACHHQVHAGVLETPHPEYMDSSWVNCETCHSAEPATPGPYYRCSACHHSEPTDISDETLSAKVVLHQSCWKCHTSGTGAEASKGCVTCHVKNEQQAEVTGG
ncbi:MAG: hypothetical protein GWM87_13205 [Xanthomonadales bacterium]|nr:hypothetical protein [Xanthomonadales bacterium]NIX13781.1 hypothetical protein [Xanthomonadales bacterium]